ncbi:hypothetical protein PAAG_11100 [Paracoccidioides lutzii Pb01]|uniref:Uncharacterized protein n=1 Tax=Paracoccidioides lutzii (strain ATCC MYA-826 / Pb01) TaxID=502779 RepID=A0A0A2V764_PARBA|nr:hypothetical protein PAAG_11100 [Paracoccidioides lutzii Pb01]KGQ02147.1 hypothetical protein PAAG_11100 [Paracoccidioides lutzii Pb01]
MRARGIGRVTWEDTIPHQISRGNKADHPRHSKKKMLMKSQFLKTSASVFASPSPALAPIPTRLPQVIQETHRKEKTPSRKEGSEWPHSLYCLSEQALPGQTGNKDQESDDKTSVTLAFSIG